MTQNTSSQKPLTRFFILLSGVAFAATSIVGVAGLFMNPAPPPEKKSKTPEQAQLSQLEAVESGYEQVLQREPDNQFALQKLVDIRIQKNDLPGAIAPMEKLVKLNPDNAQYKTLLEVIKQRASMTGTASPTDKAGTGSK
jgi:cytochrome c-type biogenesis protein CcmH/NrfG